MGSGGVTSTVDPLAPARFSRAKPQGEPAVRPIRYWLPARISDWYHGWRDGKAGIPPKPPPSRRRPPPGMPRGTVTTPHREGIIRWAQGAFAQERQRFEGLRAEALEREAGASARRDSAGAAVQEARKDLAAAARPLTGADRHRRRYGEEDRPDSVIVQRRLREHRRAAATVRVRLVRAERELAEASAALAAASQDVQQHLVEVRNRILRIHEHAHRRLASYRRTLVRWHPSGTWLNGAMGMTHPELPLWAEFPAPPEEPPPPPSGPGHIGTDEPQTDDAEEQQPAARLPLGEQTLFGSTAPPADYILLHGAPKHFQLTRQGDSYLLEDFGYGKGPFINGQPVKKAILTPGTYFDFHDIRYRVSADGTVLEVFPLFPRGEPDFIVAGLNAKNKKGVPRLTEMSFVQRRNNLLAILGPSGAGKTSLFSALVGELNQEPGGELYFRRYSLRTHAPQIRAMLGYVPQDESLFKTLSVRRLLRYAYHLRAPGTSTRRTTRIDEVCEQLRIKDKLDQLVGTLSGGERKRVSVAMELLSEPYLLMLDEPTSGLDAGMDEEMLRILKEYAAGRVRTEPRTVMVITHSTEHLRIADQLLVIAKGGTPVYAGRPGDVLEHFRAGGYIGERGGYAELMRALGAQVPGGELASAYQNGLDAALAQREAARVAGLPPDRPPNFRPRGKLREGTRQFWVLTQRQVALLLARGAAKNRYERQLKDWVQGAVTFLAPLLIAFIGSVVAGLVGGSDGLGPGPGPHGSATAITALSLLVTLCMLSGQALTYGDIINEFVIIRREHRTGILVFPVLSSKWLVFAMVATLQALVITFTYVAFWSGPKYSLVLGTDAGLFLDLAAMTITAMALGLLISSVVKRLEQAVAVITGVSIAQIALNGAFSNLSTTPVLNALSMVLPSRWGVAAAASSVDMNRISSPALYRDKLWDHSLGQWGVDMAMLAFLGLAFFTLAVWTLSRRLSSPE